MRASTLDKRKEKRERKRTNQHPERHGLKLNQEGKIPCYPHSI